MARSYPRTLLVTLLLVFAGGCLAGSDDAPADSDAAAKERTDRMEVADAVFAFSGTGTGTPATPDVQAFPFEVTQGAVAINATLTWENAPVADARLQLVDPQGEVVASGFPEEDGKASAATVEPPASGEWTVRVSTGRGVDNAFDVAVTVSFLVPLENRLADSVEMRAGGFAEINLIMEENATIDWSFTSSNGPVKWNVHTHENGETEYMAEGENTQYASTLTAPKRFIYSLMFESTAPTTLTYEIDGAFRVHSHSQ